MSNIRAKLIRRTGHCAFVCMVQRWWAAAGHHSRLTVDHRRGHHMLARMHQNWYHCYWSHAWFDEYIVSFYICNGHAQTFRPVVERLVDCCVQETNEIRGHNDYNGRGWSWNHHRKSHEIGLNAFSGIQLLNVIESCGKGHGFQFAWSAPPRSWTLKENYFGSWCGKDTFFCWFHRLQEMPT